MEALIVDDEASVRRVLGRMLKERGWSVTAAAGGREALDLTATARYELAFLDVDLGGEPDGIALAKKLRDRHPRLRIVMMSGDPDNAAKVSDAGLGAVLEKPFANSAIEGLLDAGPQAQP
ncbi:MAG: response regulator [Elusimicrobia bacterium]|nr:response regulator [Elusimicrobiota bacterium]